VTSLVQFTLASATCDSVLVDALIAAFDEEKQMAAEEGEFEFEFTTTLVNCTQVCMLERVSAQRTAAGLPSTYAHYKRMR
jgi:hypothetical protein